MQGRDFINVAIVIGILSKKHLKNNMLTHTGENHISAPNVAKLAHTKNNHTNAANVMLYLQMGLVLTHT